jgi:tRNA threonylcarbamoyl adenosine modification protein YeaZ
VLTLGLETSTRQVGCAIGDADGVLASVTVAREQRHTESLVPSVQFLLSSAGLTIADVGAIAVGLGPGLFTGLRVGVATARALAQARDLPLLGVSSLDLVAHRARAADRPVVGVMDARRGELFWACYQPGAAGVQRLGDDRVDPPDVVAAAVVELSERGSRAEAGLPAEGPGVFAGGCDTAHGRGAVADGVARPDHVAGAARVTGAGQVARAERAAGAGRATRAVVVERLAGAVVVGDGASRYPATFADMPGVSLVGGEAALPSAAVLVELAAPRVAAGERTPASEVLPRYVRAPDAAAHWLQRPPAQTMGRAGALRGGPEGRGAR